MNILSLTDKQIIREEFYKTWKTCAKERQKTPPKSLNSSSGQLLVFVLHRLIIKTGIDKKIKYQPHQHLYKLVKEIGLTCATCGNELNADSQVWEALKENVNSGSSLKRESNPDTLKLLAPKQELVATYPEEARAQQPPSIQKKKIKMKYRGREIVREVGEPMISTTKDNSKLKYRGTNYN